MSNSGTKRTGIRRWFQSDFVLSAAQKLYLLIAGLSLIAAVIGLAAVGVLELSTWRAAQQVPVPPPYVGKAASVNVDSVRAHLLPPQNIRFVVTRKFLGTPVTGDEVLGFFEADTANGLAQFPNDFDILGGTDAERFDRTQVAVRYMSKDGFVRIVARAGLKPAKALVDELNAAASALHSSQQKTYALSVVARDRVGNRSSPVNVTFTVTYGSAASAPATEQPTDLEQIARDIALIIDPQKTPLYFDAYNRALRIPEECGTTKDNAGFSTEYGNTFRQLKGHLNASNIEGFYAGLCAAWKDAVLREAAEHERADVARFAAIRQNENARAMLTLEKFATVLGQSAALWFVKQALTIFLFVSVVLAFLAIERHVSRLREAVDTIADKPHE